MSKSILQIILRVTKEGQGERQAAREAKELKGTLGELGLGSLASASALGILSGAVFAAGKYMLEGAEKAEKSNQVLAKQNQVLIATGFSAGLTSRQLNEMAAAYSKLAGVDDDVIRDAQTMLLTFRQIGRETFPEALQAALDLSTTFGGIQQSSVQLGKALNDPIAGMTALAKSGITFSEQQKGQIRTYQEMGDIQKAQAIILKEIQQQVGGTAAAMEKASNAAVRKQVAYDNLQKTIAGKLVPSQRNLNLVLADFFEMMDLGIQATQKRAEAEKKVAEQYERTSISMGKAGRSNRQYGDMVDRAMRAQEKAEAVTEYYNQQLLAQGRYFDETTGKVVSYAENLTLSEEALQELSKANQEFYKGLQSFQSMEEGFAEKSKAIADERIKIEKEKADYIQQYGTWNVAKIQEFDDALDANADKARQNADEHEKATKRTILGYMEQKMMADGILDDKEIEWLLKKGTEWGIYSQTAIQAYKDAQAEAEKYISVLNSVPLQINTKVLMTVQRQGYDWQMLASGYGYANGTDGWETVPPGYPNDSYPAFLSSGEKFAVIPAGQSFESFGGAVGGGMGGNGPQEVVIRLAGDAERLFAPMVERIMERRR
jgi:hypothetical protein